MASRRLVPCAKAVHPHEHHELKISEVRRYALSLPDVKEEPHFTLGSFRVGGKIFATVPPGGKHLRVFVDEQRREMAIAMFPGVNEKLWWGKKVVGVEVQLLQADPADVRDLLYCAWKRKAPGRLVREHSK